MGQRCQRKYERHEDQGQNDRRSPGAHLLPRFASGGPDVKLSLQAPDLNQPDLNQPATP